MKTIPFDLEKAKAGAKIVRGRNRMQPVVDWHLFAAELDYPLFVQLDSGAVTKFTRNGADCRGKVCAELDLFLLVEPKLRPWKPEEVPYPCRVKHKDWTRGWATILSVGVDGVDIAGESGGSGRPPKLELVSYQDLLDNYLYPDNHTSPNWFPCGIEE